MKTLTTLNILLVFIFGLQNQSIKAQSPHGIAVLELFTSEGCSSCPAAEDVFAEIAMENNKDVYILEFHVDYWDNLGWKDSFSNAVYSDRQRQYAHFLALQSIYTPQAIVNGSTELVGSDKTRLQKTIERQLNKYETSNINIKSQSSDNKTINVSYSISRKMNNILNIAIIQLEGKTDVKRGENAGRQLNHIHIVRDFKTIDNPNTTGNISLSLPKGLTIRDIRVLAYLQNKTNWTISGAAQSDILP
jgi:hypothetical protein